MKTWSNQIISTIPSKLTAVMIRRPRFLRLSITRNGYITTYLVDNTGNTLIYLDHKWNFVPYFVTFLICFGVGLIIIQFVKSTY